ncbi:MAG: sugar phosphate isomerase/epimerase [Rhodobacteraceae bacterium]|jgi:D-psicose/D-tagatose/L-ribulose 3-epimerase|nr:sugar phosphate isomerase/epimerase [Paracoccaceae bacterium]
MKLGFNLLLWTPHVTDEHAPILHALKDAGYDGVEVPMFEGDADHYARLGALLDRIGLERSVVSVLGAGCNPLSADADERAAALDRARWCIDNCAALGAPILGGPMHSELGAFSGEPATPDEHARAVAFHRAVGDHAAGRGITLALEALNRFECYFLNTMAQLADHVAAVDHPNIKAMYDTFHANIEEKDPVAAIATIRPHMVHVHISENDRGTPGRGHVPWDDTYRALRAAGYDGWLTIEAFGRAMPALAAATRVWRDFAPGPEQVYLEGLRNMRDGWARAV